MTQNKKHDDSPYHPLARDERASVSFDCPLDNKQVVGSALSIEKSIEGRRALRFNKIEDDSIKLNIPDNLLRKTKPYLPQLSELDTVRHFTKLSRRSFSLDTHFYTLGSCTMKYNPKVN